MVSEVLSELPRPQHWQFAVLVSHTQLTVAILRHCSIPTERHSDTAALLHKIAVRTAANILAVYYPYGTVVIAQLEIESFCYNYIMMTIYIHV